MKTQPAKDYKKDCLQVIQAAIKAANAYNAVKRFLKLRNNKLVVGMNEQEKKYDIDEFNNIRVVGLGKAGYEMAMAVEDEFSNLITEGFVVVKYGHTGKKQLKNIHIHEAGHPEPDKAGLEGAQHIMKMLNNSTEGDLVIALVSGGGSALCPLPEKGITLEDKMIVTRELLASGADIHEMNSVRKQLSVFKGGKAAEAVHPAKVIVLVISDVIGDDPDIIASGPFSPNRTNADDALNIVKKYRLQDKLPGSVMTLLKNKQKVNSNSTQIDQNIPEHFICASNQQSQRAATNKAKSLGYNVLILNSPLNGDIEQAAVKFLKWIKESKINGVHLPACFLAGGETTVRLKKGHGKGGRNQQFALFMASKIDGDRNVVFSSCGTDGTDGPTDAAGAIVDGLTRKRAFDMDLDLYDFLRRQDAYHFFKKIDGLILTGPTKTNVMDIQIAIVH
jgi:glycerate 2-kinase